MDLYQILGIVLISLGTLIMGLLSIFSRRYTKNKGLGFWRRYMVLGKNGQYDYYGITPEQIWVSFGTLLIIGGTIFTAF